MGSRRNTRGVTKSCILEVNELDDLDLKKMLENKDSQALEPSAVYKEGSTPIRVKFRPISTNCND
jgi:hypothetical protein